MSATAAEHRAKAEELDHRALRAHSPLHSRAYRRQAAEHRLEALLTEYRLNVPPSPD